MQDARTPPLQWLWLTIPTSVLAADVMLVWGGSPPHMDSPSGFLLSVVFSLCAWWSLAQLCARFAFLRWVTLLALPVWGLMLGSAWLLADVAAFPGVTALLYLVQEPLSAWKMSSSQITSLIPWLGLTLGIGWSVALASATRHTPRSPARSSALHALVFAMSALITFSLPEAEPFRNAPYLSDVRLANGIGQTATRLLTRDTQLPLITARHPVTLPAPPATPRHDVLIVLAESLRPDHLAAYGYLARETSPALEALRAERPDETFVFTHAYANSSYTVFALITLFTGLSIAHDIEELSSWPLIWHYARALDLETFFISAQELRWSNVFEFLFRAGPPDTLISAADERHPLVNDLGIDDRFTAEDARATILGLPHDRRFFGIIQTNATHFPFLPSPDAPWTIEDITSRYDAAVRLSDEVLGAALQALTQTGRLDDTLIIVLSDHAEYIHRDAEQGARTQGRLRPSSCHPTITHIPMILHVPRALQQARALSAQSLRAQTSRVVSTLDVLPTVLHAWGIAPVLPIDGQSMLSTLPADRQVTCISPNSAYPSDFMGFSIMSDAHIFYDRQDFSHAERFSPEDRAAYTEWESGERLDAAQRALFKAQIEREPTLEAMARRIEASGR